MNDEASYTCRAARVDHCCCGRCRTEHCHLDAPARGQRHDPDQIDYNLQAIDAAAKEQQELARQKEAARAAAQAAAQEAAAKEKAAAEKRAAAAARAKAQQQAAAAKEKAARQAKLDAYEDKVRELELQMKELDVTERRAQVEGTVSDAAARSELSREKAQVELDRMKAEVEALRGQMKTAQ